MVTVSKCMRALKKGLHSATLHIKNMQPQNMPFWHKDYVEM